MYQQPRGQREWSWLATKSIYKPTHKTNHYKLKTTFACAPNSSSEHRRDPTTTSTSRCTVRVLEWHLQCRHRRVLVSEVPKNHRKQPLDQSSNVYSGAHTGQIKWPPEPWLEAFGDILGISGVHFAAHIRSFQWWLLKKPHSQSPLYSEAPVAHLRWAREVNMSTLKQTSGSSS